MPRLSVDITPELKKRLMNYIAKHYDSFGKQEEVVRQAIEEFLDRHEEGEEESARK